MSELNDLFQNIQARTGSLGGSIDADTQSLGLGSLIFQNIMTAIAYNLS